MDFVRKPVVSYSSNCNKEVEIFGLLIWCQEKGKRKKFQFTKEILLKCIFGEDSCAPALGKLLLEIKQLGNIFSKFDFRIFLAATGFFNTYDITFPNQLYSAVADYHFAPWKSLLASSDNIELCI